MVSGGVASSQGPKLKAESEEGEHQGGCAGGHRRVLSGRRSGGKGKGKEGWGGYRQQHIAGNSSIHALRATADFPAAQPCSHSGLSEILPAPAKNQRKLSFFSRPSFPTSELSRSARAQLRHCYCSQLVPASHTFARQILFAAKAARAGYRRSHWLSQPHQHSASGESRPLIGCRSEIDTLRRPVVGLRSGGRRSAAVTAQNVLTAFQ